MLKRPQLKPVKPLTQFPGGPILSKGQTPKNFGNKIKMPMPGQGFKKKGLVKPLQHRGGLKMP